MKGGLTLDTSLRVLQLSTSLKGGAGIAATLLHENLRTKGFESILVTIDERDSLSSKSILSVGRGFLEKFRGGCFAKLGLKFEKRTFLSLGSSSNKKVMSYIESHDKKNTIIHIHNWFNLLSLGDIATLIRNEYKVVITLHDERLYTGGCHYSFECNGFKSDCKKCPEIPRLFEPVPRNNLSRAIAELDLAARNVKVIAPSHWISKRLISSAVGRNVVAHEIPNCLALEVPKFLNSAVNNQIRIGVASMFPFSYIKGGDTVKNFIQFADSNPDRLQVILMKNFQQDEKNLFWESLDFLLVSSRSDNSPNVIHEAHLRGIPVIASDVGGIPELMQSQFDLLVDWESSLIEQVLDDCASILNRSNFDAERSVIARNHYEHLAAAFEKHLDIYKELINQA